MGKRSKQARQKYDRNVRTTLLVVRAKLREALALSLRRRGGD
jgi:hypothetical protein